MNFSKQLLFLLVLVGPITCLPVTTPDMPFPISDDRKQDIISIVKVIGKTVESELTSINFDDNADKENRAVSIDIDLAKAEQFLQQKLPVITAKVSNAVKHNLTENQQTIVIDLLHNLKSLSSFTKDDFVKMTKVGEHMENFNKYIPEELNEKLGELTKKMDDRTRVCSLEEFEEFILIMKEFEKVDLHNESFNLLKRFICQCCYVHDIELMADIDLGGDKSALPLQKCCRYLADAILIVLSYDFSVWKEDFEKIANIFLMANSLSSALLKSIENQ